MSSLIKGKTREIISDPKKSKQLREVIFNLRNAASRGDKTQGSIKFDNETFKVQFVNQNIKRK